MAAALDPEHLVALALRDSGDERHAIRRAWDEITHAINEDHRAAWRRARDILIARIARCSHCGRRSLRPGDGVRVSAWRDGRWFCGHLCHVHGSNTNGGEPIYPAIDWRTEAA